MRNIFKSNLVLLSNKDDETLMGLVVESNHQAFEVLYNRYRGRIMSYIAPMLFDKNKVEEVTHEVFLKVFRQKDKYDPQHKFTSWLWTIARNTAIDVMRKKSDLLYEDFRDEEMDSFEVEDDSLGPEELIVEKSSSLGPSNLFSKNLTRGRGNEKLF